ncbi:MAG: hypothetical protein JSR39_01800 [Verrucomicrobia bacterium]|nr:hypothetical protein [Verrucomicrobiota bacterium]
MVTITIVKDPSPAHQPMQATVETRGMHAWDRAFNTLLTLNSVEFDLFTKVCTVRFQNNEVSTFQLSDHEVTQMIHIGAQETGKMIDLLPKVVYPRLPEAAKSRNMKIAAEQELSHFSSPTAAIQASVRKNEAEAYALQRKMVPYRTAGSALLSFGKKAPLAPFDAFVQSHSSFSSVDEMLKSRCMLERQLSSLQNEFDAWVKIKEVHKANAPVHCELSEEAIEKSLKEKNDRLAELDGFMLQVHGDINAFEQYLEEHRSPLLEKIFPQAEVSEKRAKFREAVRNINQERNQVIQDLDAMRPQVSYMRYKKAQREVEDVHRKFVSTKTQVEEIHDLERRMVKQAVDPTPYEAYRSLFVEAERVRSRRPSTMSGMDSIQDLDAHKVEFLKQTVARNGLTPELGKGGGTG